MNRKLKLLLLLLLTLLTLTACTKPVPNEERLKADVAEFAPEWDDDSEITALEITRGATDKKSKRDTVWIKVKSQSETIEYGLKIINNQSEGKL